MIAPRARVAVTAWVVLLVAACSSGSAVSDTAPPLTDTPLERVVYVALGGDETVNRQLDDPFRDAWPQRVFVDALPRSSVYVNFARPDATVDDALREQVPSATDLDPTVATVWLGAGDARIGTDDASFSQDLTDVVGRLESSGAQVLLLAQRQGEADETEFADAVARVATATGATLVVVPDGDRALPATQAAIADAVAASLPS